MALDTRDRGKQAALPTIADSAPPGALYLTQLRRVKRLNCVKVIQLLRAIVLSGSFDTISPLYIAYAKLSFSVNLYNV